MTSCFFGGDEGRKLLRIFSACFSLSQKTARRSLKNSPPDCFSLRSRPLRVQLPSYFCTKNKRSRKVTSCFLVEMRGVEPLSENSLLRLSTGVVYLLNSQNSDADKQASEFGNPLFTFSLGVRAKCVHR